MKKIGLLGFGTVGSGVYEIINKRSKELKKSTGEDIEICKILVRDVNKKRNLDFPKGILTDNPDDILKNSDIDIVVEVMGGIELPYKYITESLKNGKHVVTANKAVVCKYFEEFMYLTEENNRGFLFEASVGGGIPVLKPLKQCINTNDINIIKGILNGTTNFILSKMSDEDLSFDEALKLAHDLGYAEADPTDDIEGYDAARKIAILSSIAYRTNVGLDDVVCRGISKISTKDIHIFKELGLVVKLLANSVKNQDKFSASVEPILVGKNSLLANVKNAFNIVSIIGDAVGELQFYGQGAGKNPTGNAVVSDILDIVNGDYKSYNFKPISNISSSGVELFKGKYYLRINFKSREEMLKIKGLLKESNLKYNILQEYQELILIIDDIKANSMEEFIKKLNISDLFYVRIDGKIKKKFYNETLDDVAISVV